MERISVKDVVGTDIRSRISLNAVKALMTAGKAYVIDMEGVTFISRSVADELYNLQQDYGAVHFEHAAGFVERMMQIVWSGRSKKRVREKEDVKTLDFSSASIEEFSAFLRTL